MPQKKTEKSLVNQAEGKIPAPAVSASRAKTSRAKTWSAAPTEPTAADGAVKVKVASKTRKAATAAKTTDSLLKLNGAVNGHATSAQIAERAYFLWLEKGCPEGTADQDWSEAERQLTAH